MGRRRLLFVGLVALWWVRMDGPLARAAVGFSAPAAYAAMGVGRPAYAAALPEWCDDVCTSEASCTATCFASELDFENGVRTSCYTWGTYAMPCCGDGECTDGEDASSCLADCHCGDHTCEAYLGENSDNCPADCAGGGAPDCTGDCLENDETCDECPQDCWENEDVCGYCGDGICEADEIGGAGSGFELQCDPDSDAWCTYCSDDCGGCDPLWCWPYVCQDDEGRCQNCDEDGDCSGVYPDYFCTWYGFCANYCASSDDCLLDDFCNPDNHHCEPAHELTAG